jgi:hypothetical protein
MLSSAFSITGIDFFAPACVREDQQWHETTPRVSGGGVGA